MRHRTIGCVLAALLSVGLLWPGDAAAQRTRTARSATRPAQAARAVPRSRPPLYPRTRYYYPRYYYSPSSWYWGLGWGSGWYPYGLYGAWGYPYGYGYYGHPWYGYGQWDYPYYYGRYESYASVRVQGAPRDAQVYVDGYYVGVVDDFDGTFQRLRVSPGGHEITLHLKGYRNASERMYLQPSATYRLTTRLEPLAAGAPQDPPPTPNPDAVRSRDYDRPGAEGAEQEQEQPEPAGPPSRRWPPRQQAQERQSAQESRFGTLTLRVQPADSEVMIDGAPWRGAPDQDGVLAIQVPAGTHRIEIRSEGYVSYIADLAVRANVATPLNVMLQREE